MIHKKILIVSSYPISLPQHGGQKRVRAIRDYYERIYQEVRFVGIFSTDAYKDYESSETIAVQQETIDKINKQPYASDVISGEAIYLDGYVRDKMKKLLDEYQPDIIQVEQIYPYFGLSKHLNEFGTKPLLIYSSHNIEHAMKDAIYKDLEVPDVERREIVGGIKSLEEQISQKAALVITVSRNDELIHKKMGAKHRLVIQNGIDPIVPTQQARNYWRKFKATKKLSEIITFVGSAHQPNWVGFLDMVGQNPHFLPDATRIVIAGGVSDHFSATFKGERYNSFWQKVIPAGKLSEDSLSGLLSESDVILLPITRGGGSNLKTAEAILSGQKIVATQYAFRGFEKYRILPNVFVANDANSFKKTLIEAIESPYKRRSEKQVKLARTVEWSTVLRPLEQATRLVLIRHPISVRNIRRIKRILRRVVKRKKD